MKPAANPIPYAPKKYLRPRHLVCVLAAGSVLAACTSQAALPTPLVNLRFSEGSGLEATNSGSLGGMAAFTQPDGSGFPAFTNSAPSGAATPPGVPVSVDFGPISSSQHFGRAVDLVTTGGDGSGTLGILTAFTISGWLNPRDLAVGPGGNRIAFALESPNGNGFDLVHLANGALRLGINQWPDGASGGGPSSSAGKLKADPRMGASNWVFFVVTYDSSLASGNTKFYFGNATAMASLDVTSNYKGLEIGQGGVVPSTGPLTVGNFGSVVAARNDGGASNSRVFRGAIDDLRVYDQALDLTAIHQVQLDSAPVAVTITRQPGAVRVFAGQPASFDVEFIGSAPSTFQWQKNGVDIAGATASRYTIPAAASSDNGAAFRVRIANDASPAGVLSEPAMLTVLPENGHKVSLSFSDGASSVTNTGNIGGKGVYNVRDGFPVASQAVPAGPFAPSGNSASVNFGVIADGQGGRAIDLTNSFGNSVGPMQALTIAGWLNCADLRVGGGGNRIAFALATAGGIGFDLVHQNDGSFQLGVNQWSDAGVAPRTSAMRLTEDPAMGAANWVFFAVTYDGTTATENTRFYFGNPGQEVSLEETFDYDRGALSVTGPLTIGNFSTVVSARTATGPTGSRAFRGLIDELNIFNRVLTLEEIRALQKAPAYQPPAIEPISIVGSPRSQTIFAGETALFQVSASGTPPLRFQWWQSHAGSASAIVDATNQSFVLPNVPVSANGDEFWVVVSNASTNATSQKAALTVLPETNIKISLSFSEGQGTNTANSGNIGGSATLVQRDGFPAFSSSVPVGPYAPSNNGHSLDFGPIASGQGGRALDLTGSVTPNLGPVTAFTLTGWLNCRDLAYGPGGNRIVYSQTGMGTGGFDLVQQADGILWLGVNNWPDFPASPAMSTPRITADPDAGAANWVFFAVTYDSGADWQNTTFYFGTTQEPAAADMTVDYNRGTVAMGPFAAGNFSAVDAGARGATGSNSRVFRGLMDEIRVYNKVLSLEEIQQVQRAPAAVAPVQSPALAATRQGSQILITWDSAGAFKLQYRQPLGAGSWVDETTPPVVDGTRKTVVLPANGASGFYRLVGQ